MAFNNLPPQAYTRDVLMAAYDWLQSQPASIRELAVGPDALVSLFMQARRRTNAGSTGTVAGHQQTSTAHVPTHPSAGAPLTPFPISVQAPMTTASAEAFKQDLKSLAVDLKQFEEPKVATPQPSPDFATQPLPQPPAPAVKNPPIKQDHESMALQLDSRTRQVLSEVKQKLNVSSENEALRLLIAIGYEKIRDILPKN
jgi:septal ring-binding cell division protein DamX